MFKFTTEADGHRYISFACPGCGLTHSVPVTGPRAWGFSGTEDSPTLSPSLLVTYPRPNRPAVICHLFLRGGTIEFLQDCTHGMAGKKSR